MTLLLFNLIVDGRPSSGLRPKSVRLQVGTSGICILPSRRRAVPILQPRGRVRRAHCERDGRRVERERLPRRLGAHECVREQKENGAGACGNGRRGGTHATAQSRGKLKQEAKREELTLLSICVAMIMHHDLIAVLI